MHMFRKYTYTQVTRQLKEIDHICIFILKGFCMEDPSLNFELTSHVISIVPIECSKQRKATKEVIRECAFLIKIFTGSNLIGDKI